jgi:AraC family transcriptional regulator
MVKQKKNCNSLQPRFLRIHKARIGRHWVWPEHTNRETEFVLINKGAMRCVIENIEFQAGDGDVYFVQPGQLHFEELLSEHVDIFTLRFDLLDRKGKSCRFITSSESGAQLLKGFAKESVNLFEQILQLVWNEEPSQKKIEAIITQMTEIVRKRYSESPEPSETEAFLPHHSALADKADEYIKQNLDKPISVAEIADFCCVSPHHLAHVFKEVRGISPLRYTRRLKIDQAKRLLADESLCVYEVARHVGFKDPFHFSRSFKKETGFCPQTFRSHIRMAHL